MKPLYQALYISAVILLFLAVTGGTLTQSLFDSVSTRTLENAGIKQNYITATDDRIDEMFYTMKKVELQIEKLKNFFSPDKVDESKYKKESNGLIKKNIYDPMVNVLNIVFRLGVFLIGLIIFLTGVIFHIVYRSMDLRRRVRRLEEQLYLPRI